MKMLLVNGLHAQQAIMTSLPRSWPAPPQGAGSVLQVTAVLPLLPSQKKAPPVGSPPALDWWDFQAPAGLRVPPLPGPKFTSSSEPQEHLQILASVVRLWSPPQDRPAGRTDHLSGPPRSLKALAGEKGDRPCLPLDTLPPLPGLRRFSRNSPAPAGDVPIQEYPALSLLQIQPCRLTRVPRPSKCSSPPRSSPNTKSQFSTSGTTSQALPSLHGNQPKIFPGEIALSFPAPRHWGYFSDNTSGPSGTGRWPSRMQLRHEEVVLPPSSNSLAEMNCPSRTPLWPPVLGEAGDIVKSMAWSGKGPFIESMPFQWEPEESVPHVDNLNMTKSDIQASGPKKGGNALAKPSQIHFGKARPSGPGGGSGSNTAKLSLSEVQGIAIKPQTISKVVLATVKRSRSRASKVTSQGRSKQLGIRVGPSSQDTVIRISSLPPETALLTYGWL
uniref:Uncharacterized protein LOC110197839 n=1 Tax=Phascolarctos cinereus TaxID=38626 RepID=A0A6P5J8R9_PHACI|nr:uncharacterized protein LOC110197839 [Phascolarctos cinereus]